jgi:hypothetical protein
MRNPWKLNDFLSVEVSMTLLIVLGFSTFPSDSAIVTESSDAAGHIVILQQVTLCDYSDVVTSIREGSSKATRKSHP